MTALTALFHNIFACIRKQKLVLVPYALGMVAAFAVSPVLVRNHGIMGACTAYTIGNMTIAVIMFIMYEVVVKAGRKQTR